MRSTTKLCSALIVLGALACSASENSERSDADRERVQNLRAELAGSALNSSSQAIVSDLEVPPRAELQLMRQGDSPDPNGTALGKPANAGVRAVASVTAGQSDARAALNSANDSLALDARLGKIRVTAPSLTLVAPMATTAAQPQPMELPSPKAPRIETMPGQREGDEGAIRDSSGTPADSVVPKDADRKPERRPRPPEVTGDIIRGGPARPGIDPCAKHFPIPVNAPRGTVMVNNRLPSTTVGGIRIPR